MKINVIKPYRLQNEEHFWFMTEVKDLVERTGARYLDVEDIFSEFLSFYKKEDCLLQQEAKTAVSKKMEESDTKRDDYHYGIEMIIKGYLRHSKLEIRNAAKILKQIFDKYGDLRPLPYEQETEAIIAFCSDMEKYKVALECLNLTEWIEMLKDENNTFQKYFTQFESNTDSQDSSLKSVRRVLDGLYKDLIIRMEALSMVKGDWKYVDFGNQLNRIIDKILKSSSPNPVINNVPVQEKHRPETFY